MPYRLYVPCGKIGCSRNTWLGGKMGCSRQTGLCGKTTAGLETDFVVDSWSFLLASELCSTNPIPNMLQTARATTQTRRLGLLTAIMLGDRTEKRLEDERRATLGPREPSLGAAVGSRFWRVWRLMGVSRASTP